MQPLAPFSPPWRDQGENWKKEAKLMGWDKDSLTEPQRKRKITILVKRTYKARDT